MNAWTPERELRLAELWEANAPLIAICERLGRSMSSVVSKANQIGLARRSSAEWPDELTERLRRLWDENYTASEIGRALGRSRNAILGKAHRIGLSERKSPLSDTEKAARITARLDARRVARREYKTAWAREERAEGRRRPSPERTPPASSYARLGRVPEYSVARPSQ